MLLEPEERVCVMREFKIIRCVNYVWEGHRAPPLQASHLSIRERESILFFRN
jgi:hypothetical protein